MKQKKFSLKDYGIGPRTLKTALAAFLCIVVAEIFRYDRMPAYACVTTCIAMQDTSEHSMELGKNRLLGTLLAGVLSLFSIWILGLAGHVEWSPYVSPIVMIIGFAVCNITDRRELCSLTGVVILAIMMGDLSVTPLGQALRRLLETGAGVIIAVLVNKYVMPNHACVAQTTDDDAHKSDNANSMTLQKTIADETEKNKTSHSVPITKASQKISAKTNVHKTKHRNSKKKKSKR